MRNKLLTFNLIIILIIFSGLMTDSYAHFGSKGPFGGSVSCGTTDGTIVYLGTKYGGVYESTNSSLVAWRARPVGLKDGKITALVHTTSYLIAGTEDSGVYILNGYVGTDRYWNKINNGLTNLKIRSLVAIDTITILAGTDGGGVFKTTNKGASWVSVSGATLNDEVITAFAKAGDRIFLASQNTGIFISDDDGMTWSDFNDGNTAHITGTNALSYNETTDELLILNSNGLFNAGTAGTTTTPVYATAQTGLPSLTIRALSNNGADWYLATDAGMYSSTTGTIHWASINNGLTANALDVTTIVPVQTNLVIGTIGAGIFKSTAVSVNWISNNTNFNNLKTYSMVCKDELLVVAATEKGVFVSKDLAANYSSANTGLEDSLHVNDLIFSGTNLFACTEHSGIFVSTDTGKTWSTHNLGLTNLTIRKMAVSDSYLYAICSNGTVYQSSALGWISIQNGLPSGVTPTSFAFYNGAVLLGTLGNGVYTRPETSGTWTASSSGLANLMVTSVTTNGNKLFAGTDGSGVFVSDLSVIQWTATSALSISHTTLIGLDATKVQAMAYFQGYVYASYKGGLVVSSDNGATWIAGGNQFNLPSYTDVHKISFVTTRVFVTTENNSLYSNSLGELPVLTSVTNNFEDNIDKIFISPNPNNGQFNLSFNNTSSAVSEIIIFNAQGSLMGRFDKYITEFSVSYPKGLYHLQVNSIEGNATKKIVIE